MSNTYHFITSNVVIGESSVPGYAFKTRTAGVIELSQLGATGYVEVDGNVEATGLRLVRVGAERVLASGYQGDVTSATYPGASVGDASQMVSGVLDDARLVGDYQFGNIVVANTLTASAIGGNIDATSVVSGLVDDSRLDGTYHFDSLQSIHVAAANAIGDLDTSSIVDGTLHPDRLGASTQYTFDSLQLTGNGQAAFVSANVAASSLVVGTLPNERLVGPYTVQYASANTLVSNTLILSTHPVERGLVYDGGNVVSSVTTIQELGHLRDLEGPIQDQLDTIHNGLVVGNTITHLDATQITLNTLHDDRLQGAYTFQNLDLSGGLYANHVSANLDAADLQVGVIDPVRIEGAYLDMTNLTLTGTLDAADVSANLRADQLVDGTIDDDRLGGAYSFDTLNTTTVHAAWAFGNLDTSNVVSGILPIERYDFHAVDSNIVANTLVGPGYHLGDVDGSWLSLHTNTGFIDDVVIETSIQQGDARMQFDFNSISSNIVPASSVYSIGTPDVSWSNVYATDVSVDDLVLSAALFDAAGVPLAFDLENVPISINPKANTSISFGTVDRPWTSLRASSLAATTLTGNVIQSSLVPESAVDFGTLALRWDDLVAANLTGSIDGHTVGDIWARADDVSGNIEALDGVTLPSQSVAFRFFDDESTGLHLRDDGQVPGGLDFSVGGSVVTSIEPGTLTQAGGLVPVDSARWSLGRDGGAWSNLYASNVFTSIGILGTSETIVSPTSVVCSGNVEASTVDVSGQVVANSFVGNLDAASLTGIVPDGRFGGSYVVANLDVSNTLTITGELTCGNLVPTTNAVADLGSSTARFRDLYLANTSIHLGDATLSEVDGFVTLSSNLIVTNGISGAGIRTPLTITAVDVTDSSWNVVDDTAVSSSSGGYIQVTGSGFAPASIVQVGDDTNASSTTFVSSTVLRCVVPARSNGSYDVRVIRPDTSVATLPSAITYSAMVTWITGSNLGNVYGNTEFSIQVQATSDSVVSYSANLSLLPPQTTLDPVTGTLSGNITSVADSTLYSFNIEARDEELQETTRTFLLQYLVS